MFLVKQLIGSIIEIWLNNAVFEKLEALQLTKNPRCGGYSDSIVDIEFKEITPHWSFIKWKYPSTGKKKSLLKIIADKYETEYSIYSETPYSIVLNHSSAVTDSNYNYICYTNYIKNFTPNYLDKYSIPKHSTFFQQLVLFIIFISSVALIIHFKL